MTFAGVVSIKTAMPILKTAATDSVATRLKLETIEGLPGRINEMAIRNGKSPPRGTRARSEADALSLPERGSLDIAMDVLHMIPRVGKISTSDIRERLSALGHHRSDRTLQRLMKTLTARYPIELDDSSKPFGYKWKRDAAGISIPALKLEESLLMLMAEKYLRNLLPPSVTKSMEGLFRQARHNMEGQSNSKLEKRWMDKVCVASTTQQLLPPEINPGVLEAVSSALYFETWLDVDYLNAKEERKSKRVIPLALAQQGSRLLLIVRFEGFSDDRSLALNRMLTACDTGLSHPRVPEFDLKEFTDKGGFGFGKGELINLTFRIERISGQYLIESRLSNDQVVKDLGDQYEISATVLLSEQLIWWLRGFGNRIKVISPQGLIQRL